MALSNVEISKVDLAKYKENSNSELILEVDLEYLEELRLT